MAYTFIDRLRHTFNAFRDRDPTTMYPTNIGPSSSRRQDRVQLRMGTEKSIVSSIYTRIAIDVASVSVQHVRVDQNGSFLATINSGLNNCLTMEANIDQPARAFLQDVVMSMFDEGAVAIVPVDTSTSPADSNSWDILTMRTGRIVEWYPYHVRVNLYNEARGMKEDIILAKRDIAIVENPLYSVMNESGSTLKRLVHKLNILDAIDEQSGSGKLDLVIQLPYVVKTEARKLQAEQRRKDIEDQLSGTKYGIAYTDGTEKITQLNRPAENNLMGQIEYLTSMLYSQLGLTTAVFDGSADEKTMNNYHSRTIEPIISAIVDRMKCRFLTKTATSQGQTIMHFRDRFGLVTASDLSVMADSLSRNAIVTPNEFRSVIGFKPSGDPVADTLSNKNLNQVNNPLSTPNLQPAQPSIQDIVNNATKGVARNG